MYPSIAALSPRMVLRFDGILCLVMGGALIALRDLLSTPTGLPPGFLAGAGALLLPVGLFILAVSWPARPHRAGVAIVVAGNALWVVASLGVLLTSVISPTALGFVVIIGQAGLVTAIAALEALPFASQPPNYG